MAALFSDLAHPSTIAALLVEAALVGLALVAASGRLARGLAAVTLVLGLVGAAGMLLEAWTFPLPVVLPDAVLGTYARPTQLGLLVGAFAFGVVAVGAALAFRRPGLGGLLLLAAGLWDLLDGQRQRLQDPTLPPGSATFGLVAVALPILAVGALLLATRWAERRGAGRSGRPSTPTPRPFSAAP
jgi:hypothetical protein